MDSSVLNEIARRAEYPTHRGRLMKSRKVLNLVSAYFWKDSPVLGLIPKGLPECDYEKWNIGLVNLYSEQKAISAHTDSSAGMVLSSGVYSVSYGIKDSCPCEDGVVIGSFWLGEKKMEIKSGVPLTFDGYNIKHRASTKK